MKSSTIARQLAEVHAQARALAHLTGKSSAYYSECIQNPTEDAEAVLKEATQLLCRANRIVRKEVTKPRMQKIWQSILQPSAEDISNEAAPLK